MKKNLEEKVDAANVRIKELQILIERWKDALKNQSNNK